MKQIVAIVILLIMVFVGCKKRLNEEEQAMLDKELVQVSFDGDIDKVNSFLIAGANVDAKIGAGMSASYSATFSQNANIAKLLIGAGADVNAVNSSGYTVLMAASTNWGCDEIIELLLEAGADFSIEDNEVKTVLTYAKELGTNSIVQLLLDAGATE